MAITLRAARVNAGLTQSEAGKKIGVSRQTLANWEQEKSFPNVNQIKQIEKTYGVRYSDIIFCPSITL